MRASRSTTAGQRSKARSKCRASPAAARRCGWIFIDPGGATTGRLLPSGRVRDVLDVAGVGRIEVSMVDAANACVFVRARDVGLTGTESPDALEADAAAMQKLSAIRIAASLAMGIGRERRRRGGQAVESGHRHRCAAARCGDVVGAPRCAPTAVDLTARMLAKGRAHRALPLTRTLCLATAARIEGTLVHEAARAGGDPDAEFRIGMPSGVMVAAATVMREDGAWRVGRGAFLRTQRRLFDGHVLVRAAALK